MGNTFWTNQIDILFKDGNYKKFMPKDNMTIEEQLNAITRLCLYFIFLTVFFGKDDKWVIFAMFVIVMTAIIYNYAPEQISGFSNISEGEDEEENEEVIFIEDVENKQEKQEKKSDEEDEEEQPKCRKPTADNPFMNPNVLDYGTDYPAACNADDADIKDNISMHFNKDLYLNTEDLWNKKNSQRQFCTIPSKVPLRQKEFAEWLYKDKNSCKKDQKHCLKYEDLRYSRFPHVNSSTNPL